MRQNTVEVCGLSEGGNECRWRGKAEKRAASGQSGPAFCRRSGTSLRLPSTFSSTKSPWSNPLLSEITLVGSIKITQLTYVLYSTLISVLRTKHTNTFIRVCTGVLWWLESCRLSSNSSPPPTSVGVRLWKLLPKFQPSRH